GDVEQAAVQHAGRQVRHGLVGDDVQVVPDRLGPHSAECAVRAGDVGGEPTAADVGHPHHVAGHERDRPHPARRRGRPGCGRGGGRDSRQQGERERPGDGDGEGTTHVHAMVLPAPDRSRKVTSLAEGRHGAYPPAPSWMSTVDSAVRRRGRAGPGILRAWRMPTPTLTSTITPTPTTGSPITGPTRPIRTWSTGRTRRPGWRWPPARTRPGTRPSRRHW